MDIRRMVIGSLSACALMVLYKLLQPYQTSIPHPALYTIWEGLHFSVAYFIAMVAASLSPSSTIFPYSITFSFGITWEIWEWATTQSQVWATEIAQWYLGTPKLGFSLPDAFLDVGLELLAVFVFLNKQQIRTWISNKKINHFDAG